ncbi:serine/threonine-protein kinase [Nocardia sp. CNY236]|uniref:serine/threonine-protein kinase n=1 Tax=Nocardia sp. CNY236 TaxID=1169152 RepID=UPI00041E10B5|nr:serine/threonine-protein kinase [Nocardia sp. CNY236]
MSSPRTDAVARFTADWQHSLEGDRLPPRIRDYAPDGTRVRATVLAELVRIDLQRRWEHKGLGKRIAEYREEFPEIEHSTQLVDLVCAEFAERRRHAPLSLADFLAEYPDLASEVGQRLADHARTTSAADRNDAMATVADLQPGQRIDDFDLLTYLGASVLGRVFLARQRSMQRLVAVRFSVGRADVPHTMAQLDHPNIVRIFDQRIPSTGSFTASVEHTPPSDTRTATTVSPRLLYMQYIPGGTAVDILEHRRRAPAPHGGALLLQSVDAAMEAKGEIRLTDSTIRAELARLSWPETVAWVGRRLADALDYAERQGVLHHDIKPANVLFTAEGAPKLADFALGEWAPDTAAAQHAGADSLAYRSPEQLTRYLDPDAPAPGNGSDIYSLGVLLWELLTGASPFDDPPPDRHGPTAETCAEMLAIRRTGVTPRAMARLPEDTPASLRRVLLDCLRLDPKNRWRSGAELAAQLELCLDTHARGLVDPPPNSLAYRARGWLLLLGALCIGVPNALASIYNIQLNQNLIIDRMSPIEQEKFAAVGLVNNLIAFPSAALLLVFLTRRPLSIGLRLGRGHEYSDRTLAAARRDTLLMGDWAVWVPFGFWVVAGIAWPLALASSGVDLPSHMFVHFFAAQLVCAAIALAYPFFPIMVYSIRSVYLLLLVRGEIGPSDERQLRALAKRSNFYLGVAASVPLLGVASATFVDTDDLEVVIVPVRLLSVGGILAFVLTYKLFRVLEADVYALTRAIPQQPS